jgi:hypothetical protein
MGGYYASAARHVAVYDDAGSPAFLEGARLGVPAPELGRQASSATRQKLRHEVAHLLVFAVADLPDQSRVPAWLTEGLAESFARGALSGETVASPNPDSLDAVRAFYERSRARVDAIAITDPSRLGALLRGDVDAPADTPSDAATVSAVGAR